MPRTDDRPTLLFLHIWKTAGVTLRQVLAHNYAASRTLMTPAPPSPRFRHQHAEVIRGERDVPDYERENAHDPNGTSKRELAALSPTKLVNLRLVRGHFYYGLHEAIPRSTEYMTLLRDPIERVLSLYAHTSNLGLGLDLGAYIEGARDWALDNEQVRRLAGSDVDGDVLRKPCTDEMLAVATRNLIDGCAAFGLSERFDESLVLMARRFGWGDLSYVSENTGRGRPRREQIDPRLLAKIEEHNTQDARLYETAAKVFAERLAAAPDVEREVAAVREHNARIGPIEARMRVLRARLRGGNLPRRVLWRAAQTSDVIRQRLGGSGVGGRG